MATTITSHVADVRIDYPKGWRGRGACRREVTLVLSGEMSDDFAAALRGAIVALKVDDDGNLIGAIQGGAVPVAHDGAEVA